MRLANAIDASLLAPKLPEQFCSYIDAPPDKLSSPVQVEFSQPGSPSARLDLVGFTLQAPGTLSLSTAYLSVTTSWQVKSPIKTPLQLVVLISDKNGQEHFVSRDIPSIFWCQTNTWKPGTIVTVTSRVFFLGDLHLPVGPAHIALALVPLLQSSSTMMDVQARLPLQVLHAPATVRSSQDTRALQLLPLTLVP